MGVVAACDAARPRIEVESVDQLLGQKKEEDKDDDDGRDVAQQFQIRARKKSYRQVFRTPRHPEDRADDQCKDARVDADTNGGKQTLQ